MERVLNIVSVRRCVLVSSTICLLIAAASARPLHAQVAPIGAHEATSGPGGGVVSSVSPTGGFAASIPIDLPSPRGPLPIPFSVAYTGTPQGGAAGAGWDVPLWYVRLSTTSVNRKPAADNSLGRDAVRPRLLLTTGGATQLMVESTTAGTYYPFVSDEYAELVDSGGSWILRTATNLEYAFAPATTYGLDDPTLWLLAEIRDRRGSDRVVVEYEVRGTTQSPELNVTGFQYAFNAAGTPLYDIELAYDSWDSAFATVDTGGKLLTRRTHLTSVRVNARNNLDASSTPKAIRTYALTYAPDADTGGPRLQSVQMTGEAGIAGPVIPVATYVYGAVSSNGVVRYGAPRAVPRNPLTELVSAYGLGSSSVSSDGSWNVRTESVRSRYAIRDFTGDGVPDFVFKTSGTWHLIRGRATADGPTLDSGEMTTWSEPKEIFEQRTFSYIFHPDADERADMITTETLAQFIDWNADGRLDVLDARGSDGNHWKLWLNTTGANGMPVWVPVEVPIWDLRAHIERYNLGLGIYNSGYVALERTRTWQQLWSETCEDLSHGTGNACPPESVETGKIDTVAEWLLTDVNADGYVDTVANTNPVRQCDIEIEDESFDLDYNWRTTSHQEFVTASRCTGDDADIPDNHYVALLNRGGALLNVVGRTYEVPVSGWAGRGVAHWTTGEAGLVPAPGEVMPPLDLGVSWRTHGFTSEHGQRPRFNDWMPSTGIERFENDRSDVCGPGGGGNGIYTSTQVRGLADLNGDGIPDRIHRELSGWEVEFGRTSGYGPTRRIAQSLSFPFALSESKGACQGEAHTIAGLVDLDGDGKPELVRSVEGVLMAASIELAGGAPDAHGAGRLIAIGNGYGARTEIRYANNKTETRTAHQLVAPEIVVAQTQVLIEDGSAADSVITRYAYGEADSRYDPTLNRMVFTGYRRQVTLVGGRGTRTGPTEVFGHAVVTERRPPAAFAAAHDELVLGGRVVEIRRFEGNLPMDPRVLLDPTANLGQLRAKSTLTYGVVELPTAAPTSFGLLDCIDVEVEHSSPHFAAICSHAAVVYAKTSFSWHGTQSPDEGAANVALLTDVVKVDALGRPTETVDYGDTRTVADDRCITIQYANATDPAAPQITAPAGIWTTDCGWIKAKYYPGGGFEAGDPVVIAGRRFVYDALPEGEVGRGRLTSSILERYDTSTGEPLGDFVVETTAHDELGNIRHVTSERLLGTIASRTTTFEYDAFDLTTTSSSESASDVAQPPFVQRREASVWPSVPLVESGINGERTILARDALGRTIQSRVIGGSIDHVVATFMYVDEPGGRKVVQTTYAASDRAERSHVHLDALGRTRFTQVELGADYDDTTLVSGFVEYDGFGRAAYRASTFEWPELPFMPESLPAEATKWPRGMTVVFDAGGRVVRVVEADGKRPLEIQTSVPDGIFVARSSYAWLDGKAVAASQGPANNDPSSATYGASQVTRRTGIGRVVEDARYSPAGTRLDLVHRGHDRLGAETTVTRYRVPATATEGVTWTRRFDSTGLLLSLDEPGTATVRNSYDEWGNLVQSQWSEATVLHTLRRAFDGFGRLTRKQAVTSPPGGSPESSEFTEHHYYDVHSGSPLQPESPMRGLVSRVEAVGVGDTFYGYDHLLRLTSETHLLAGYGQPVRIAHVLEAGGAERELQYETAAGTDRIEYMRDSAGRVRSVVDLSTGVALFTATALDAKGRYRAMTFGNGVTQNVSFAEGGREDLKDWVLSTTSGVWVDAFVARDADGRLLVEHAANQPHRFDTTYGYDQLGRLSSSRTLGSSFSSNRDDILTYDPLGNVVSKRSNFNSSHNRDFKYDALDRDRLCRVQRLGQSGTACNVFYDGAGNVTRDTWTDTTRTYRYDSASRIVEASKGTWRASFLYGPGGGLARTEVFNGATLDRRIWNFGGLVEERRRPGGKTHIERRVPGPLGPIATLRSQGALTETIYVHGDGRGSQVFTGKDGSIVQGVRYRAYGAVSSNTGTPSSISYSDDLWNGGDDLKDLGIVVLGARIYDPVLGRFLQRDPIAFSGSASTGNPYSFAFDDPVNFADPSGLFSSLSGSCMGLECSGGSGGAGAVFLAFSIANEVFNRLDNKPGSPARGRAEVPWHMGTCSDPGCLGTNIGDVALSVKEGGILGAEDWWRSKTEINPCDVLLDWFGSCSRAQMDHLHRVVTDPGGYICEDLGGGNCVRGAVRAATPTLIDLGIEVATGWGRGKLGGFPRLAPRRARQGGGEARGEGVFHVTPDGVVLPKGPKYAIPAGYSENKSRVGSYGVFINGTYSERLRIDPATPPGRKGPNRSHYHRNQGGKHHSPAPGDSDPGFEE